jgi:hypothetical protein
MVGHDRTADIYSLNQTSDRSAQGGEDPAYMLTQLESDWRLSEWIQERQLWLLTDIIAVDECEHAIRDQIKHPAEPIPCLSFERAEVIMACIPAVITL